MIHMLPFKGPVRTEEAWMRSNGIIPICDDVRLSTLSWFFAYSVQRGGSAFQVRKCLSLEHMGHSSNTITQGCAAACYCKGSPSFLMLNRIIHILISGTCTAPGLNIVS